MTTAELLATFRKLGALVVGDICLDRWCTYDPATSEASRETGIPRIGVVATEVTPGGGGTVANNLAALGTGQVAVLGIRGDDGFGFELVKALNQRGVTADLMVEIPAWHTFTYTKLLNCRTGVEDLPSFPQGLPPRRRRRRLSTTSLQLSRVSTSYSSRIRLRLTWAEWLQVLSAI